ncbi:PulJ/GspJ family protein [Planctomicrobium piriforme]|uniref:Prepilin-type N-terminal cleavage/methylation domain-containing protein n=1 Tax=Planctomicrobium piriforme TaxID=1576369 RepID=A0A1I3RVW2_9PLAN|nr:hypothetical protein [Planctomicrobium piriforme]SFJ50724.1 hypothetical protein SAMN05421753_12225 [Planctomicrobium piriforme]
MKPARGQFDSQRPLGHAGQERFFVVRTRRPQLSAPVAQASSGFTLVEMLVSTGLVVLIMLLFAQIFGSAIGTMTEQRGMANNDQKARNLSGVLRGDLQNMTYRQPAWPYGTVQGIVPLAAGDEPIIDPANQRGYFYFSENDPAIDWDDVLQFTTMIRSGQRGDAPTNNQQRPYVGKASSLSTNGNNEPDMDDGIANGQGQSRAAEISYFLRNGNLCRRVMLLRDPLPASPSFDVQPTYSSASTNGPIRVYGTPTSFMSGNNTVRSYSGDFYNDFDYAASRQSDGSGTYLLFHSVDSLDNHLGRTNSPIAQSYTRYGFNPNTGIPVEFDSNSAFFGRFTAEETSSTGTGGFLWPGQTPTNNPYTRTDLTDTTSPIGTIDQYQTNTNRIGEDILLTNVEAFNIEVLDPGANGFVSIGASSPVAAVTYLNSQNADYKSAGGLSNIYDTWHPAMTSDLNVGASPYQAPFRPLVTATGSFSANWSGLGSSLTTGTTLAVPSMTYVRSATTYQNYSLAYQVISAGTKGSKPPEFPPMPGVIVQDGTARWQCVDNRVGLKAIRITVRYRDVSSNLSRQVTLVHSFVE